jgi:lipopolysaccharide assembly outer membrane protein LptD (OstA)
LAKKINLLKKVFFFISCCIVFASFQNLLAQAPTKILIEHSDFFDVNQIEAPDAALLSGNVRINHDGIIMTCNKAYYFQKENYIKAFGNVQLVQGDTLFLNILQVPSSLSN